MSGRLFLNFWHWFLLGPALRTEAQLEEEVDLVIRLCDGGVPDALPERPARDASSGFTKSD